VYILLLNFCVKFRTTVGIIAEISTKVTEGYLLCLPCRSNCKVSAFVYLYLLWN